MTMVVQSLLNRVTGLLSLLSTEAKATAYMGLQDFNRLAENVVIPVLSCTFGWNQLRNLNWKIEHDHPAIDLGDDLSRVAVQVTATSDLGKIKDTLDKFCRAGLPAKYDRLVVYILTEKQKRYSQSSIDSTLKGRFEFNSRSDIIDYRDVLRELRYADVSALQSVCESLENNFARAQTFVFQEQPRQNTEQLVLNWVPLQIPRTIYIADLDIPGERKQFRGQIESLPNQIKRFIAESGRSFAIDWVCHERTVVTFHDLTEDTPLHDVIDLGTLTPLEPSEYYTMDDDYERAFKFLLRKTMQQQLYHFGIYWQHEERLFFFVSNDTQTTRIETWHGETTAHREVCRCTMKSDRPNQILECKHLAFRVTFDQIDDNWYLTLKPDWFFSYDGYRRSFRCADRVDWLKKREHNLNVLNHLRFIADYLRRTTEHSIFQQRTPFLHFGELVTLDGAPPLADEVWLAASSKSVSRKPTPSDYGQERLPL